ncbi:MAG TPA: HAMP domain-containing sensor histidine kinase [Solirubrobacteraceae bacterium]|jgi:two-component system sensor histidine kinase MprB
MTPSLPKPLKRGTANMSFRRRITLVSAAAVAVAVVLASALTYLLVSHQLRGQVDEQLRNRSGGLRFIANTAPGGLSGREVRYLAGVLTSSGRRKLLAADHKSGAPLGLLISPPTPIVPGKVGRHGVPGPNSIVALQGNPFGNLSPHPDQVRGYQQLIDSSGKILFRSSTNLTLPIDAATLRLAAKGGKPYYRDADTQGIHLRILTETLRAGYAVQLAQPLTSVDKLLNRLRNILILLDIGGIALAALLGRLVAGAAVRPVRRLTQASEHVTRTRDLSERIDPVGMDEIGRLARSFNAMLDALQSSMNALDASVDAQRQLVADASHELRTPVTSLRTNIEILKQERDMAPTERERMLDDVVEQIEELTLLMNDLIELARGEQPQTGSEDVRLDLVVEEAIERARRHSPDTPFQVKLDRVVLTGAPDRLGRAVNNLVDNAVNYSPPGSPVEVSLHGAELTVRDHGPGISTGDLPHVFDRFYRGVEARGRSGSGLGLAIVRQVAEQHGGTISARPAAGGGTLMCLRLPGSGPVESAPDEPALQHAHSPETVPG